MRAPMNLAGMFGGMNPQPQAMPVAQWEFNMGPGRPYRPRQEWIDTINNSVDRVFGPESVVDLFSGSSIDYHGDGPDRPRYGSNRHETGFAGDFRVTRPDGSTVNTGDPDADAFMLDVARAGALGVGHGSEYMGPAFHVDMVRPGPGQGHYWGSNARRIGDQLVAAMQQNGNPGVPGGSRPGRVPPVTPLSGPVAVADTGSPAPAASGGAGTPPLSFGDAPAAAAADGSAVLADAVAPGLPFGMNNGLGTMLAMRRRDREEEREQADRERRLALIDLMRV